MLPRAEFTARWPLCRTIALAIVASSGFAFTASPAAEEPDRPPNFILIFVDNLGYGDVGCFGPAKHNTPHLDRMAAEGMKLTHCYATAGVCTPSRASLMTGCYPRRVGLDFPDPDGAVLRPISPNGLHPDEVTIAEVLKTKGYATTIIGKWHLGDQPVFLPTRQGFDSFFGIFYPLSPSSPAPRFRRIVSSTAVTSGRCSPARKARVHPTKLSTTTTSTSCSAFAPVNGNCACRCNRSSTR